MERASPPQSFSTRYSRVWSPSAANTGACARDLAVMLLRVLRDIAFDVLHLLGPATVIHAECFQASVAGDLVEAGFREHEQGTARDRLESEFDKRGRLVRVVLRGVYGVRVPGEREELFGLHFLYYSLPLEVFISCVGY